MSHRPHPVPSPCARVLLALRRTVLAGAFGALFGAVPAAAQDHPPARGVPVRLIGFNDFHGHLEPGNNALVLRDPADATKTLRVPAGGAPWLAGLIDKLRAETPNTAVFSSGDLIGATPLVSALFRHESTIAVMNAIGLDFAIVGNHELDAGIAELRRVARGGCAADAGRRETATSSCVTGAYAGMSFPLLAANVEGTDGKPVFAPTFVKRFGGIPVGFIGVLTRTTPGIVMPSGVAGLRFRSEAEVLNRQAAELRRRGVEAIVAVVHEGGAVEADWNDIGCSGAQGEIFEIANRLSPAIDLVFSAHTHQGYNCVIDTPNQRGLRVIQATSYGRGVSVIDVVLDPTTHDIDRGRTRSVNIPVVNAPDAQEKFAPVPVDSAITKLVREYVALAAPRADRAVGSITQRIDRGAREDGDLVPDFPAGRLIADAQLEAARSKAAGGAQIALMNSGGIRSALACEGTPPCLVTYGQAFTMQPFGNSLVVMTLTGRQLKALLEDQHKPKGSRPHFLQPSQGFAYTWKRGAPYGERVRDLRLDGAAVEPEGRYRVVVNSFLAEGGDGFKRLRNGSDRIGGTLDIDALVDYLRSHSPYAPDPSARITVAD